MPLMDKRSNLTSNNARNADVASRLSESIIPLQQQKLMSAFHVQGVQALLYNRISTGLPCSCMSKEKIVAVRLGQDGKAESGVINQVITGDAKFGISSYNPLSPDADFDDLNNFHDQQTSPNDQMNQFLGDLIKAGHDDGHNNLITEEPTVGSVQQFSPDIESIYREYDLGSIGITDVSCPICFGSGYIGGFAPFRAWRQVISSTQVQSRSTFQLPGIALRPGTHTFTLVLPKGAILLDAFRAFNNDQIIGAQILIDEQDTANTRVLNWFDGQPHTITLNCNDPFTHFEAQAGLSNEPIYFEFPRRSRSQDIAFLEKQDPFQIIVSPDVPHLNTLDVIAESQLGRMLIVQNTNPWVSRNRQFLGWDCQVRVAQPAELWRILPHRRPITHQRTVNVSGPSKTKATGGLSGVKGFEF